MNFKSQETHQKLNGCYYTPSWIAEYISRWVTDGHVNTILEPSCGDGAFFDAISGVTDNNIIFTGFDIDNEVADICRNKLADAGYEHHIITGDFIRWALNNLSADAPITFDAVVGNPPFIRYQYLDSSVQNNAQLLFKQLNVRFTKHTNAWIPFLMASIEFLNPGGKIGMVVPSEILHVLYAKELRSYLLDKCQNILLIDPEDLWFENTLQGAMILMAEKKENSNIPSEGVAIIRTKGLDFSFNNPTVLFDEAEYFNGEFLANKWTYALLTPQEREVYLRLCDSPQVNEFRNIANADVGIVTGANSYFLVPDSTVEKYNLQRVAHPMFGRSEHCPGIIYDAEQHQANAARGLPTNFLYFDNSDDHITYQQYLAIGEDLELPNRYKCRIRTPWYKVPSVYSSPISMLKRSNGMPRLILNVANAFTTDTAYRILPYDGFQPEALVRCFLNTLTALSAELEGRHYGGGVLELVPSEIERLAVPYTEEAFVDLHELNDIVKNNAVDDVLEFQDNLLFPAIGIAHGDIAVLQGALQRIKNRRQRNEEPDVL